MPEIIQHPENPDSVARKAAVQIYGTAAGMLRRRELARLMNAWGLQVPAGASKDSMLVFFKQLEAEGKDPFQPPGGKRSIPETPTYNGKSVADIKPVEEAPKVEMPVVENVAQPAPEGETYLTALRAQLLKLPSYKLKHMCKTEGIKTAATDDKLILSDKLIKQYMAT